jgi:HEAT repeat protein
MMRRTLTNVLAAALLLVVAAGCSKDEGGRLSLRRTTAEDMAEQMFDLEDPDRRREGILALSEKDYGLREPYLAGYALILESDENPLVRAAAARALGKSQDPNYVPHLAAAMEDPTVVVRWDAAAALDRNPGPGAVDPLMEHAVGDESMDVRAASADALKHYSRAEVISTLRRALGDDEYGVRHRAHQSLVHIVGRDLGHEPEDWTREAVEAKPQADPDRPWWDWFKVTDPQPAGSPVEEAALEPGQANS